MRRIIGITLLALAMSTDLATGAGSITITAARVIRDRVFINGTRAPRKSPILWEGKPLGNATEANGSFAFVSEDRPWNCVGTLTIGSKTRKVVLNDCTPIPSPFPEPVYEPGVPKTGQISSYGTGDDGALEKGITPGFPRFVRNVNAADDDGMGGGIPGNQICDGTEPCNGTVTDTLTGLIWPTNGDCFGRRSWEGAVTEANNLADGACGISDGSVPGDWRLPNIRELLSLVDYGRFNPTLPLGQPFNIFRAGFYWSSTTSVEFPWPTASGIYFGYGDMGHPVKTDQYYVLPVRGGP